ncbi:MAG: hypothetical protein M1826_003092 [Phylliscum demangeonii]|nr:MAG: hypothetical protein M1826_003092 [Phylliscum demangeonii]
MPPTKSKQGSGAHEACLPNDSPPRRRRPPLEHKVWFPAEETNEGLRCSDKKSGVVQRLMTWLTAELCGPFPSDRIVSAEMIVRPPPPPPIRVRRPVPWRQRRAPDGGSGSRARAESDESSTSDAVDAFPFPWHPPRDAMRHCLPPQHRLTAPVTNGSPG